MEAELRAVLQTHALRGWSEAIETACRAPKTFQPESRDILVCDKKPRRCAMSHQVHKLCSLALCDDAWFGQVRTTAGVRFEEPKTFLGVVCRIEPAFEECHSTHTVPNVLSKRRNIVGWRPGRVGTVRQVLEAEWRKTREEALFSQFVLIRRGFQCACTLVHCLQLTTTEIFLIVVLSERARVVVLKRWRHVSGVTVILVPRGLGSAGEQSLTDIAVVVVIVDVASLFLKHSKRIGTGRGRTQHHARHIHARSSFLDGMAQSLIDGVVSRFFSPAGENPT